MINRLLNILILFVVLIGCSNQGDNKSVEISLKTIQCGMCSNKIADGLNKLDGIKKVDVDLKKKVFGFTLKFFKTFCITMSSFILSPSCQIVLKILSI